MCVLHCFLFASFSLCHCQSSFSVTVGMSVCLSICQALLSVASQSLYLLLSSSTSLSLLSVCVWVVICLLALISYQSLIPQSSEIFPPASFFFQVFSRHIHQWPEITPGSLILCVLILHAIFLGGYHLSGFILSEFYEFFLISFRPTSFFFHLNSHNPLLIVFYTCLYITIIVYLYLCFLLSFILERKKGKREKHRFVVPLIYAFIGWFLYVPWLVIKPATLMYLDGALLSKLATDCVFVVGLGKKTK